jgi:hypothetical protein
MLKPNLVGVNRTMVSLITEKRLLWIQWILNLLVVNQIKFYNSLKSQIRRLLICRIAT